MLEPLQVNIFFTAVLMAAYKRFSADNAVSDDFVHVVKETGDGGKLSAMLYDDNAGIVSRLPAS